MATRELRAQRRAVVGKQVKTLRRAGFVPASLYGPGLDSTALQVAAKELDATLRRTSPTTLLPLIVEDDAPRRVLVREVQRHPVTEQALHVDFFAVSMSERMRAAVPLVLVGEAPAVTQLKGTLLPSLESVDVECLPDDLPARLEADVSSLEGFDSRLHVSDVVLPPGVTLLTPEDTVIATVAAPRVEEEAEAEAEAATEEAAAEGETAEPSATAETSAETDEAAGE
jgi:large subunit ribosomal protein L25